MDGQPNGNGTQGVARLKELLFESERHRLEAIAGELTRQSEAARTARQALDRRIDGVDGLTRTLNEQVAERIEQVFAQAGTRERLRKSVAAILDGALRDAEVDRHREVSLAIAPYVVNSIKSEIVNSRDDMVEALYPITGRLVKAYVANAVKDMMAEIDGRLESRLSGRRLLVKLKSLVTGKPESFYALAELRRPEMEELFLIRRGSGELVGHWEKTADSGPGARVPVQRKSEGRESMVGSLLTAITSFAETAFEAEAGTESLRRLQREKDCIYLRATPAYLLAARCAGTAPAAVEQTIDNELVRTLERHGTVHASLASRDGEADAKVAKVLPELAGRLDLAMAEQLTRTTRAGYGRFLTLLALLLLPIAAWIGWQAYTNYELNTARAAVRGAITATSELRGYPIHAAVERRGRHVTLTGLAPSQTFRDALMARVKGVVPGAEVVDELAVLPVTALPDYNRAIEAARVEIQAGTERRIAEVEPRVVSAAASEAEARVLRPAIIDSLGRTSRRLADIEPGLSGLQADTDEPAERQRVAAALAGVTETRGAIDSLAQRLRRGATDGDRRAVRETLRAATTRLAAAIDVLAAAPRAASLPPPVGEQDSELTASAELLLAAERVGGAVTAVSEARARKLLERSLAALAKRVDTLPRPADATPRERLMQWTHNNAIFFGNGIELRQEADAAARLDALAALIRETTGIVRVVGYTDERGQQTRNQSLSLQRADVVAAALVTRGVPRERLVTVGRTAGFDISPEVGPTSPSRRVEIEVGFIGEGGARP